MKGNFNGTLKTHKHAVIHNCSLMFTKNNYDKKLTLVAFFTLSSIMCAHRLFIQCMRVNLLVIV